jgi:hypothetical protein
LHAQTALEIFVALTASDGYSRLFSHIGDDPTEPALFLLKLGPKLGMARGGLASLLGATVDAKLARIFRQGGAKTTADLFEWQHKRWAVAQL